MGSEPCRGFQVEHAADTLVCVRSERVIARPVVRCPGMALIFRHRPTDVSASIRSSMPAIVLYVNAMRLELMWRCPLATAAQRAALEGEPICS